MSRTAWIILVIVVVVIAVAFAASRLNDYNISANAYTPPQRDLAQVEFEAAARSARLEAVDNPAVSQGVVVVDYSHRNALFVEELNILLTKLVARGFSYEIVSGGGGDDDESDADGNNGAGLAGKLSYASALILPLPRDEYSDEEIAEIERFVEKGGRVFIIGDPTRTVFVEALNSIAGSFGIIFANDYLYSLEDNDNNYRNVIYSSFADSPLTQGLDEGDRVIFYSGGSVNAPGHEIILGDENVFSSRSEGGRTMAAAVLTHEDQVLALADLTFMGEPYSAAESNGTLINNIADFLTGAQRNYELEDFPYFFNPDVDIVFDNPLVFNSQFEDAVKVKEFLEATERTVTFADDISDTNDVIFVGRFDEADVVDEYLTAANITIIEAEPDAKEGELALVGDLAEEDQDNEQIAEESDVSPDQDQEYVEGRIQIEGVGELERGGSTLFLLHQDGARNILSILSDNPDTNADAFELLLEGQFTECLVSASTAVCQTEEPDKQLIPSVRKTRIDKILVVSDDDGRERADAQTSLAEYTTVLSGTYKVDAWVTSTDDSPDLAELQEYDAVIWTTGDYWDDSIGHKDAQLLTKYIEAGGNLILSGASIAFDWDHTDFLSTVVHADYITFAGQEDLEPVLLDHAIAKGFDEEAVITFVGTPSGETLEPDAVSHTADARVILQRGPDSEEAGAPAVIAYEDDRSKVAYFAFPVYLLALEDGDRLVNNTVNWFTRKPLELPDEKDFEPYGDVESGGEDEAESEEEPAAEDEEDTTEGEEGSGEESGEGGGDNGGS
jgi:hypothetical protein